MNKYKLKNIQLFVMLSISLVILVIIFSSIENYQTQFTDLETDRIVEVVEKYAIQCYATEGAYPPNVYYLQEHYGLILNEDKFIYEYEPIAENIKPVIQVFIKPGVE